jgi:hypothetical protein
LVFDKIVIIMMYILCSRPEPFQDSLWLLSKNLFQPWSAFVVEQSFKVVGKLSSESLRTYQANVYEDEIKLTVFRIKHINDRWKKMEYADIVANAHINSKAQWTPDRILSVRAW